MLCYANSNTQNKSFMRVENLIKKFLSHPIFCHISFTIPLPGTPSSQYQVITLCKVIPTSRRRINLRNCYLFPVIKGTNPRSTVIVWHSRISFTNRSETPRKSFPFDYPENADQLLELFRVTSKSFCVEKKYKSRWFHFNHETTYLLWSGGPKRGGDETAERWTVAILFDVWSIKPISILVSIPSCSVKFSRVPTNWPSKQFWLVLSTCTDCRAAATDWKFGKLIERMLRIRCFEFVTELLDKDQIAVAINA